MAFNFDNSTNIRPVKSTGFGTSTFSTPPDKSPFSLKSIYVLINSNPFAKEIIVTEEIIKELTKEKQDLITAQQVLQTLANEDTVNSMYTCGRKRDIKELAKRISQKSRQLTVKQIKLTELQNKNTQL